MMLFNPKQLKHFIKSACLYVGAALLLAGCVDFSAPPAESSSGFEAEDKLLTVSFLDVGQADSILVDLPDGKHILIDGGNNADGEPLARHLIREGIEVLDLLVATHPHEDHIGGLCDVLEAVEVKQIYMPEISEKDTPTTKVYENFLDAVINEGCDVYPAAAGETVLSGEDYTLTCLSPARSDIGDLNNYSVVLRLCYNNAEFLFTGDAEEEIEEEILNNGLEVSADVIKVGHHGSSTSSSKRFIEAVNPSYGVISCGEGNKYGHPNANTLRTFSEADVPLYRTDILGTILITTNGEDFKVTNDTNLCLDGNRK